MATNLTPEERLLRVIESGGEERKFVLTDFRSWPALLQSGKERLRKGFGAGLSVEWARSEFSLKRGNQALTVLLLLFLGGLAYDLNRVQPRVEALTGAAVGSKPGATTEEPLASLRPLDEYLQEVGMRDLFSPPRPPAPPQSETSQPDPAKVSVPEAPPPPTPLQILQEKAKGLKLVGISFEPPGGAPIAMIEDTASHKTYFLKKGESIDQIKIEGIMENRAVLGYEGVTFELF